MCKYVLVHSRDYKFNPDAGTAVLKCSLPAMRLEARRAVGREGFELGACFWARVITKTLTSEDCS